MASILVVEHDQAQQEQLRNLLFSQYGGNIQSVSDGEAAIPLIRRDAFDAIVVNCDSSPLDRINLAAIARLSRKNRQASLLLTSVGHWRKSLEKLVGLGSTTIIEPASEPRELAQAIRQSLLQRSDKRSSGIDPMIPDLVVPTVQSGLEKYMGCRLDHVHHFNPRDSELLTCLVPLDHDQRPGFLALNMNKLGLTRLYHNLLGPRETFHERVAASLFRRVTDRIAHDTARILADKLNLHTETDEAFLIRGNLFSIKQQDSAVGFRECFVNEHLRCTTSFYLRPREATQDHIETSAVTI